MTLLFGPFGQPLGSTSLPFTAQRNAVPPAVDEPRGTDHQDGAVEPVVVDEPGLSIRVTEVPDLRTRYPDFAFASGPMRDDGIAEVVMPGSITELGRFFASARVPQDLQRGPAAADEGPGVERRSNYVPGRPAPLPQDFWRGPAAADEGPGVERRSNVVTPGRKPNLYDLQRGPAAADEGPGVTRFALEVPAGRRPLTVDFTLAPAAADEGPGVSRTEGTVPRGKAPPLFDWAQHPAAADEGPGVSRSHTDLPAIFSTKIVIDCVHGPVEDVTTAIEPGARWLEVPQFGRLVFQLGFTAGPISADATPAPTPTPTPPIMGPGGGGGISFEYLPKECVYDPDLDRLACFYAWEARQPKSKAARKKGRRLVRAHRAVLPTPRPPAPVLAPYTQPAPQISFGKVLVLVGIGVALGFALSRMLSKKAEPAAKRNPKPARAAKKKPRRKTGRR